MPLAGGALAVHLGGGWVELCSADPAARRALAAYAARIDPFRAPCAPAEFGGPSWCIRVQVAVGAPDAVEPSFDPDFRYRRFDLGFAAHRDGQRATATFDGHPGGLDAVLELAVAAALRRVGGLLLHATAAVLDGGGWVLPGPSGTGKSTAARGGGFDRVLTDERAIARRDPGHDTGRDAGPDTGRWWVFGTPWWSSGRQLPLDPGAAPVTDLIRLRKAADPGAGAIAHALAPDAAAAWLLGSVALYETTPAARRASFEQACDLVEAARCREVWFPREGAWSRSIKTG